MKDSLIAGIILVVAFVACSCTNNRELDRRMVEKIYAAEGLNYVKILIDHYHESNDSKLLIENGFANINNDKNEGFIPTKKIMPYFIGTDNPREQPGVLSWCTGYCKDAILVAANVEKISCTGITEMDQNNKNADISLYVSPNELGKLFKIKNPINIKTRFKLYDDDWRLEEILWDETAKNDSWIQKNLMGSQVSIVC